MNHEQSGSIKNSNGFSTVMAIVIVLALLVGAGAYYYRYQQAKKQDQKNQDTIAQLQAKITDLESKVSSTSSSGTSQQVTSVPTATTISNIKAAITSGNTAALEGYMADSVMVIVAASDGIGSRTPAQAVGDLAYLKNATSPWNFNLSSDVLAKYASGDYKVYFKTNSLVGVSANNYVVVFNFDSQGKINGIFMASSSSLL